MIYYFIHKAEGPSGGHQISYNHVAMLNELGYPAAVVHPDENYRYEGLVGDCPTVLGPNTVAREGDLIVFPGILPRQALNYWEKTKRPFAIANMSAYIGVCPEGVEAHRKAAFVLADGEDTRRILQEEFGLDPRKVYEFTVSIDWDWWAGPKEKEKRIVAIPRKRGFEWQFVKTLFDVPGWEIVELENVPIEKVREEFHRAAIVVGLAKFESVSIQYLEAAAARCQVVGFDGFGAREYWDPPIFKSTKEGDPVALLRDLQKAAREWKGWTLEMEQQRLELAERYSRKNELEMLKRIPEWPGFARQ